MIAVLRFVRAAFLGGGSGAFTRDVCPVPPFEGFVDCEVGFFVLF